MIRYQQKRKSVPQIVNYGGFQQLSGILVTCPICLGDMCGCQEDLVTKGFRICKGCSEEFKAQWGRTPSKAQIRKAIKILVAKGLWDTKTHSVPKVA